MAMLPMWHKQLGFRVVLSENILYGKPMDKIQYKKAIKACALDKDIESFAHGDMTEIGERGLNMSGGQKQRIQLARAVSFGILPYD